MAKELFRQGDVLFERIEELPAGTRARTSRVLVEGEVTGHAHRVAETSQASVHVIDGTALMYLQCAAATMIVHEEHHTVTLPQGIYAVTVQREYSPLRAIDRKETSMLTSFNPAPWGTWYHTAIRLTDDPAGEASDLGADNCPCDRCGYDGPGGGFALYEMDEGCYHWLCEDCAGLV